jgi:transmembrane sensor
MAARDESGEAAAWVARLDRFGDNPEVKAQFERWLAEDERRQGAILRAEMTWAMLDRAKALPGMSVGRRRRPVSRRAFMAGAVGTAAAAAAGGVAFWNWHGLANTYRAGEGEFRRFRLKDGSTIALNADSEMHVAIAPYARTARLAFGEAWLQISADPDRPFLVHASDLAVRADNSAFAISRNTDSVDVMVTEGAVQLRSRPVGSPMVLASGTRAVIQRNGQVQKMQVSRLDIDRALAWREGRIALAGESLGEAIRAFNRYNTRKLVVMDAELAAAKLDGWFSLDDPLAFANAAAESLNAQVHLERDRIVLTSKIPLSAT